MRSGGKNRVHVEVRSLKLVMQVKVMTVQMVMQVATNAMLSILKV